MKTKKEKTTVLNLRIPTKMKRDLQTTAQVRGKSMSELIRDHIDLANKTAL